MHRNLRTQQGGNLNVLSHLSGENLFVNFLLFLLTLLKNSTFMCSILGSHYLKHS